MTEAEVVDFPSAAERERACIDDQVRKAMDVDTARAHVDAGYMSPRRYIELYHTPPKPLG